MKGLLKEELIRNKGRMSEKTILSPLVIEKRDFCQGIVDKSFSSLEKTSNYFIFFNRRLVKEEQVELKLFKEDEHENHTKFTVLALFYIKNETIGIERIFIMNTNDFISFRNIKGGTYKVLKLSQMTRLFKDDKVVIVPTAESIVLEMEVEIVENKKAKNNSSYKPLSLYQFMNEDHLKREACGTLDHTEDDYLDYLVHVYELVLLNYLKKSNSLIQGAFIDHLQRRAILSKNATHQLSFDFMAQLVRYHLEYNTYSPFATEVIEKSNDIHHLSIDKISFPLIDLIIEYELFLFSNQNHYDNDEMHSLLLNHVKEMKNVVEHFNYLPQWYRYLFNNGKGEDAFWDKEGRLYKIRYEWLLLLAPSLMEMLTPLKGYVFIDENKMMTIIPSIYQLVLKDMFVYILYVNLYKNLTTKSAYNTLYLNEAHYFNENVAHYVESTCRLFEKPQYNDFFHFIHANDGESSPIVKEWIKQELHLKLSSQSPGHRRGGGGGGSFKHLSKLVDIEDIRLVKNDSRKRKNGDYDVLPPCMRRVMNIRKPGFKNHDRMNMVKYFDQMGYTRDEIATIIDREQMTLGDINDIVNSIKNMAHLKKGNDYMSCKSLINLREAGDSSLRCVYEEEHSNRILKGNRPGKYGPEEQTNFISQCFSCFKGRESSHYPSPLKYIELKSSTKVL